MSSYVNFPGEVQIKGQALNPAPGSNLSGTYEYSVVVNGDATIAGNTIIAGDLVVAGVLSNPGGFSLTVNGALHVNYQLNFTTASPIAAQGNLIVYGDLVLGNKSIHHTSPTITSTGYDSGNGSFDTTFNLDALNADNGGSLCTMLTGPEAGHTGHVFWADLSGVGTGPWAVFVEDGNIDPTNVTSGDTFKLEWDQTAGSSFNVNAGQSPILDVRGNMMGGLNGNGNIGANGLTVSVRGLAVGAFSLQGGAADATHAAGNGGVGNFFGGLIGGVSANGGSSDQAAFNAGNGGVLQVNAIWTGNAECSGGNGSNGANGGNGGSASISADGYPQNNLYLQGGSCVGGGGAPSHGAGDGGTVTITGDALNFIRVGGGNVSGNFSNANGSTVHAGNGGTITVIGSWIHEFNTNSYIDANGGSDAGSTSSNTVTIQCGNGGTVVINGDMVPDIQGAQLNGGGHFTSPTLKIIGGNGGSLSVYGTASALANDLFSQIHLDGGDGANAGAGGNGGTVVMKSGYATTLSINGGASDAGQPKGKAGSATLGPNFVVKTLLSALDGATGTPTTGGAQISFSGACAVKTLSVANRSDAHIGADNDITTLNIGSLTDKKTLWNGTVESVDVSGMVATTIFKLAGAVWSFISAGGGGANGTLSNLTSPTLINQSLTFDTAGSYAVQIADNSVADASNGNTLSVFAQNKTAGTGAGGPIVLSAGTSSGGVGGNATLTATGSSVGNGGTLTLTAGAATGTTGNGGAISMISGSASVASGTGISGSINIASGNGNGVGGTALSGAVTIQTGPATGNSGDLTIQTGTSGATGGLIIIRGQQGTTAGGGVSILAGAGGTGGTLSISSGQGTGGSNAGPLNITGGSANVAGVGGTVTIAGGASTTGVNGNVIVRGSNTATAANAGGSASLLGGTGGSIASGIGGAVTVQGGTGTTNSTGTGGALLVAGGDSTNTNGTGGATTVRGGNGAAGGSGVGANLILAGGTGATAGNIQLQTGGSARVTISNTGDVTFTGAIASAVSQTTLTGTAGTAICSQPFSGISYKKVVIFLNGYTDTGTQTYTYPTPFVNTPYVYGLTSGVAGATASTTAITFTVTTLTGFVFLEGF